MEERQNGLEREKIPGGVKEIAKAIVDAAYAVDGFESMRECFEVNPQHIKMTTSDMGDLMPDGNWLRYIFARPSSKAYHSANDMGKTRVFEKDYLIPPTAKVYTGRLSTEWVNADLKEGEGSGTSSNYLQALVKLVNKYYADYFEVKEENGAYYLEHVKQEPFSLKDLPNGFDPAFSRRYVTSLLAKPFVILTGNSGTGKTRIAKQFAEYLEVRDSNGERNWLLVPVGADWTDNTRVLGFYNPIAENGQGKYEKTGILRLLERALANSDVPFFLILDEMNLSHVERYFADFLSHMETTGHPFELDGYSREDSEGGRTNKLPYPQNLFVIGTVNIDETTYMFSPKVLDRANVVEFKPEREQVLQMFTAPVQMEKPAPARLGVAAAFLRLSKEIRGGKCELDGAELEKVQETFAKIYEVTEKQGYEFAYRTVREIRQYLAAAKMLSEAWDDAELYRAMDEQLLQKILPKIHGNRKEIGSMLDELEDICCQDGMEFVLSEKKIRQMKGKLAAVQYASFI